MVTDNYTTKTAALKATSIDARFMSSKSIDADKIKIKGKDITEMMGLNLPEDYAKLVTRCELPENEFWTIMDDNGNVLYLNEAVLTNGNSLFAGTLTNKSFDIDMRNLTDGTKMFQRCYHLESFKSDLKSLTVGGNMFHGCTELTKVEINLPLLTNGNGMFASTNLTSFNSDLSSLTDGTNMFWYCEKLESFNSDLSSLTDGTNMFFGCYKLTSFDSDLSSLTDGIDMFTCCKLDADSVEKILTTIPTHTDGQTHELAICVLDADAVSKFNEITGNTNDIPEINRPCESGLLVNYKGWTLSVGIGTYEY